MQESVAGDAQERFIPDQHVVADIPVPNNDDSSSHQQTGTEALWEKYAVPIVFLVFGITISLLSPAP